MIASPPMTLAEIRLRVATRTSVIQQNDTTGAIEASDTEPGYSKLSRAIADGAAEFWRAHEWSFLTQFIQFSLDPEGDSAINIAGDPTRYLLPQAVQSLPKTTVMYRGPDGRPGHQVNVRHMDEVTAQAFLDPNTTGSPVFCGAEYSRNLTPGLSGAGGIEFRVWPVPDQAYTIGFRARLGLTPFVDENQRGPWPAVHDLTVIDCAVREYFKHDRASDSPDRRAAESDAAKSLAASIERDNEDFRTHTLGARGETDWPRGRLVELFDYTTNTTLVSRVVYA